MVCCISYAMIYTSTLCVRKWQKTAVIKYDVIGAKREMERGDELDE